MAAAEMALDFLTRFDEGKDDFDEVLVESEVRSKTGNHIVKEEKEGKSEPVPAEIIAETCKTDFHIITDEEDEWLNCEECFSTFPPDQKDLHKCLPSSSHPKTFSLQPLPAKPSSISPSQTDELLPIVEENVMYLDIRRNRSSRRKGEKMEENNKEMEKYNCTHCKGWASTIRLLKSHIQSKHGFIAREDRMKSESNVKESSNAGQFQIRDVKSTHSKIANSPNTVSVPSFFQFGSLDQPSQQGMPLVSVEKMKLPKRTSVDLAAKEKSTSLQKIYLAPKEKSTSLQNGVKEVADGSCPLCGQAFTNLTRLENHASRCKGRLAKA